MIFKVVKYFHNIPSMEEHGSITFRREKVVALMYGNKFNFVGNIRNRSFNFIYNNIINSRPT